LLCGEPFTTTTTTTTTTTNTTTSTTTETSTTECSYDPQSPDACKPSFYTISSEKTIGSYLSFGYGIVGLYFTVVFTIGRFVHMSVMGMKATVMYDDLPRVDVLKELCDTIYVARMYKNLILEEELYRELIDIYRRPQSLYDRTGPFRHWVGSDEDDNAKFSYALQVEKEIEKYT
jgi:hypothetical protein